MSEHKWVEITEIDGIACVNKDTCYCTECGLFRFISFSRKYIYSSKGGPFTGYIYIEEPSCGEVIMQEVLE